jgi:acyl-CoA thioester hydrolase
MSRRRVKHLQFSEAPEYPTLRASVTHRVAFSEVDPMGIVWFGRYTVFFEEASAVLRDACGLSHAGFYAAGIQPPVVSYEVEYLQPSRLDEVLTVTARLHGTEASRLNMSYQVHGPDGALRVAARTVQVFMDVRSGTVCFVAPQIWTDCLVRWRRGEFACLHG